MTPALRLRELTVCAPGERRLLDGVTLDVPAVGVHGLIGANGAGKSTVLRAVLGVQAIRAGRIEIAGRALADWPAAQLARHLGYMPQQTLCHWDLRVDEMLRLRSPKLDPALLECCRVRALLERRFASLSGGEQARVVLARTLAHAPRLVLADEPAASLDLPQQHEMLALLRDVAAAGDCAFVVVLHDLHLAGRYCDRLSVLADGRLLADGEPAEVLREAVLRQAYKAPIQALNVAGRRHFTLP